MAQVLIVNVNGEYQTSEVAARDFGDFARATVNGWTEGVILSEFGVAFVVNELGKMLELPYNAAATEAFWFAGGDRDEYLVGDAIIAGLPRSENVSSLSAEQIQQLESTMRAAGAHEVR